MLIRSAPMRAMLMLTLLAALACSAPALVAPTATPTDVPATALPTLPPTPTLPPEWVEVAPGLELRAVPIPAEGKSGAATAVLLRLDLSRVDLTVHYDQSAPAGVAAWSDRLGALAVTNGSYFQQDDSPAGLVVAGGQRLGVSWQGSENYREGMLSVTGGRVSIRALLAQPYDPAEPLDQAVQGLPMLIDGGAVSFDLPDRAALRTAAALDGAGRLLIIHVGDGAITLTRLRDWLLGQSDLGIVTALNLDGGASTGLVVNGPYPVRRDSAAKVPGVLTVTAR